MGLAKLLMNNKRVILENLFIGRARWDRLLGIVERAEQKWNADFKDEQVLTFIVSAAYAMAQLPGAASISNLLSNGNVSTEKLWFEVLPFPTRQLEGNTNLDLAVGNIKLRPDTKSGIQLTEGIDAAICFCEFKWLSDISLDVSHDVHRNQLARVIENALLFSDERGRMADNVCVTLVTPEIFKSRSQFSRLYQYKWQDYQIDELLMADLDNSSLELRNDLPVPSERVSILNLNWVSYEDLVLAAPPSILRDEVVNFFRNLSIATFNS